MPLPPSSLVEAAKELQRRRTIRRDLAAWCECALEPFGQKPARHHLLLIRELEDIAHGRNDRLMVFMPPGSAKSTYGSVLFPPWFMAQHPASTVIGASHTMDLSTYFSRKLMGVIRENSLVLGYGLASENVEGWATTSGAEYKASGVGSTIIGRRADLVIIDDPVNGAEGADSKTARDGAWNWYTGDVIGRLRPGARIVLIMTRWHEDDLAGRLLKAEKEGGDKWRVVKLPAIAGSNDALGRGTGEALWPDWEGLEALKRKRRVIGERHWSAQYQQQPSRDEGSIIRRDYWRPWSTEIIGTALKRRPLPIPGSGGEMAPGAILISLDTAYTSKSSNDASAYTVWHLIDYAGVSVRDLPSDLARPMVATESERPGAPIAYDLRAKILLRYAKAVRLEFPELIVELEELIDSFSIKGVPLRMLVEAKASGLSVVQELRRRLPHLAIQAVNPGNTDKVARAHSITALMEAGRVYALTMDDGLAWRPWAEALIAECAAFPLGEFDDQVDSVTMALRHFRDMGIELFSEDVPEPVLQLEQEPLY